jgi:3',5'-cyclic AMP phosphodiesterase CpdA
MIRDKRLFAFLACAAVAAVLLLAAPLPLPVNDFRFSILGDRTGEAQPEVYGRVWREVDLLHPDFVINAGDTIQGGNDATADAEWNALQPIWKQYPYPLYFTPGNHDIWSEASRRVYEKHTGRPSFYSFNRQNAHFTVLDNSGSLELSDEQMRFLEQDLAAHAARAPKFVFFHQPFWLIPLKLQNTSLPFHQLMRKYHVDYVVCGHIHQFSRMERDGIVYLVVGSSGGHLRGNQPLRDFAKGWFYQHLWVSVHGSQVRVTVKEIDGPLGKGRMFKAEEWGEAGALFPADDPASQVKPRT